MQFLNFFIKNKMKTGQTCVESGIYRCSKHSTKEIALSKGETFPPCSYDGGHGATWILVRATK